MKILIVEDDEVLCGALGTHLGSAGYDFDCCHDGETGCYRAQQDGYDLILLDRMLPGMDGLALLRALRGRGIAAPVLMMTALGAVGDRVDGLDAGADDYLGKPFAVEELLARVRALVRRPQRLEAAHALAAGDLSLDPPRRTLRGPGGESVLSKTESQLLEVLLRNAGQVLPRALLYARVWGPDTDVEEQCVDNYVHFVRRRLRSVGSACRIETIRSVGYRLEAGT